jgi:hypothetical protein
VTVAALIGVLALVALLIDARWVGLGVQAVLLTGVLARRLAGSVRRWSKPPPPPLLIASASAPYETIAVIGRSLGAPRSIPLGHRSLTPATNYMFDADVESL